MNTAYEMGAYNASAQMMAEGVRELVAAEAGWDAEMVRMGLVSLAKQFEETKEKFEKELDSIA